MRWIKLGRLYSPSGTHPKLCSHAANPLPVLLDGDIHRVFFSGRDAVNRSSVGWVDIDIARRLVVRECDAPVFEHGPEGSFYSHGVSIGNCYEADGRRYILFMAWQRPETGHWRGDIGRLELHRDMRLTLDGNTPFLGTDVTDPISLSYPWVMPWGDGGYRMWYGSTLAWDAGNNEMLHVIHQADSADGHGWRRRGLALPYAPGRAQAFSRPIVLATDQGYDMWFSYRAGHGHTYRIGRAHSDDGDHWELRLDEGGLDVSPSGWDAEMVEYPFVFEHRDARYMLYNGNGFGRSGFGLAVFEP